jgi:hypothetical protein
MPEPGALLAPRPTLGTERPYGWRWHTSKIGSWLRPVSAAHLTETVAQGLAPAGPSPGRVMVVVDRDDRVEVARQLGQACRVAGRFVVHTSPRLHGPARLQSEVLRALGKHWDRGAQGTTAPLGALTRAWLRAEQARDLILLRAHQISGPALRWALELAAGEGLRLWLICPQSLPEVHAAAVPVTVHTASPIDAAALLARTHDAGHVGCEDFNRPAAASGTDISPATGLTLETAHRLRRLYDLEAAALATAAILLDCPAAEVLAAAGIQVATDAATVSATRGSVLAVPEYARALLRGWAAQPLLPSG